MTNIGDITMDELRHVGVKGMKWGVRKDSTPSSRPSNSEIKLARKQRRAAKKNYKTTRKISEQEIALAKARMKVAHDAYKNHPAKKTARYMTTGEKRAVKILGGTLAAGASAAALSTVAPSAAKTTASLVSEGMMPGHLANVGESVSVYWR